MGRDGTDKKERILDAAIQVFADRGYFVSRVSDISRRAGVAYGLIYHYFPSKEDILIAIFRDRWERYLDAIDQIDRDIEDPCEKLRSIATYIFKSYRQYPAMMKVLIMDLPQLERFYEQENSQIYQRAIERIAAIIQHGQEEGAFHGDVHPLLAAYTLIGSIDMVLRQYVYGIGIAREIDIDTALSFINGHALKGLLAPR